MLNLKDEGDNPDVLCCLANLLNDAIYPSCVRPDGLRRMVAPMSYNRLVNKSFEQFVNGGTNGYC